MFEKARSGRDAFTFSLQGMRAMASFTVASAIADDRINRSIDRRLGRVQEDQPDTVHEIENFLARCCAPGRSRAA